MTPSNLDIYLIELPEQHVPLSGGCIAGKNETLYLTSHNMNAFISPHVQYVHITGNTKCAPKTIMCCLESLP
jgi:hypothetical protein